MEHEPWSREDVQDGTVAKYYAAMKAKEDKEKNTFENSLSNIDTLKDIQENGTKSEKLKAFDYLVKTKTEPTAEPELTDSEKRGARMKIRVPFPNKLIDKG